MNKIYKLKYDKRRNQLVAVSELATGAGKETTGRTAAPAGPADISTFRKLMGILTPLALLTGLVMSFLPGMALANPDLPSGGQIVAGQGNISTNGNQMTINQNTHGMVTNWNSFDIGQNHTVQFVQPDSSAVALNRVTGGHESQILGTLTANGQVILVNPSGVMFGKGARVNTAGLVASTKKISNTDFMAGHYTFSGGSNPGAEVVNQGNLTTTKGGYIVLAADRVKNSGTIRTPGGKTVLAAGDTVTLKLDNTGLASVSVTGSVVNALVENHGLLSATDGQVYLTARGKEMLLNTVVNNSGTVEATGLTGQGGEIVLNGGDSGVVSQSGVLLTDSGAGHGGKITVEGQNIHLAENSKTSATGKTGGGEVYVGGGWQGGDSRIHNASKVVMDKNATVDVSATESGNGGTAVLWSDDYTNFRGSVLARGGGQSGHGGRVETSSHKNLQAFGDVDTSTPAGRGGEWLLDPLDVTIVSGDANTGVTEKTDTDRVFSPSASGAQISAQKIADQLNAGTDVTVDTHADGQEQGNITFAKDASIKKNTGGDATLTLKADKDITFVDRGWSGRNNTGMGAIVSTTGKLNLNLLTGNSGQNGKTTFGSYARLYLNGGDVFIGPANAAAGSASVFFKNDGTINAGNITLNTAGGVTGNYYALNAGGDLKVTGPLSVKTGYGNRLPSDFTAGGRLSITADSGDISFSAPITNGEEAGGKIFIKGKDGVDIRADNGHLVMNVVDKSQATINISSSNGSVNLSGMVQDGTDALTLTNVNISSKGQTTLNGTTGWGKAAVLSGLNISADGDVNINGISPGRASALGVNLSGSSITSTTGNITVTGVAATDKVHPDISTLTVSNSNLTANGTTGKIVLNGTTETTTGVKVTSSNLSSASLDVKGVATIQGTGFTLTNSHLLDGLADLKNVILSSAGSAAGATNTLDSSIVTADNRDTLLALHPENITKIDMGGASIFDDSGKTDKGWMADFTSEKTPNGGWIFNNASVISGGTVDLKGVGFTNSTMTLSEGSLRIDNPGETNLNGTKISAEKGSVQIYSDTRNINLNLGKITAGNDIDLIADKGPVAVSGADYSNRYNITTTKGNVTISAGGGNTAVTLTNVCITASSGDILITGATTEKKSGVRFNNVNMTANSDSGKIDVEAKSSGYFDDLQEFGSLYFGAENNFAAHSMNFKGSNSGGDLGSGIAFIDTTNTFEGGVNISGDGGKGVSFRRTSLSFKNGEAVISGISNKNSAHNNSYYGAGAIFFDGESTYNVIRVDTILNNASLTMKADSSGVHSLSQMGVGAFAISGAQTGNLVPGMNFSGNGNVKIIGHANDGSGVDSRYFNNINLNGNFEIEGTSNTGAGVNLNDKLNVNLNGAVITGSSNSAAGVNIVTGNGGDPVVNLGENKITGKSKTGAGIIINGKNVTITKGTLTGTVTSGTRPGISLTGGENYTLDGVNITGTSVDGAGVSANGNLVLNNGTVLNGTATASGSGVVVSGSLTNTEGDNTQITGTATSGDGIRISGNSSLVNAALTGKSSSGTGVNVVQDLKLSGTSSVNGTSETATGVNIARNLTVIPVKDEGGNITSQAVITGESRGNGAGVILGADLTDGVVKGISSSGTGLQLADNTTVTGSTLTGSSTSGDGVAVTGKVVLDDTSARQLKAESQDGDGLSLKDGADISIVNISQSVQPKKDAEGHEITDSSGKPITETVTTTVPVSTPVTLEGTSRTSSGVTTSGNVSVSGVTLSGSTSADNGTGVTLGGHLTVADDISGVTATATGNGTALKISDGVIDAKGYGDAGEALVLSASSENGTAISTNGNSSLSNVELQGTAIGNGNAVVISGSLSTDKSLTATSQGDEGTGLQLNGGHLESTAADNAPVNVTVSAAGNGTAVAVTRPEGDGADSRIGGINLAVTADKGTLLDIAGDLTTDSDISVSTSNGTAISLNGGSLQGADGEHPVTVTAQATGNGTAVTVKPVTEGKAESSLANITLNTTSVQGDALNVGGVLNTKDVVVTANTSGTGTALNVSGGVIHSLGSTNITAMSDSGSVAVVDDGKLNGDSAGALTVTATTTTDGPALNISGESDISNSVVSGENRGNNSAVTVAGVVTSSGGGEIKGQTVNGTAVEIKNGTSATSSQDGGLLITAVANGEQGTGVTLSGATLTGSQINAGATQGNAVTITDGNITGGIITGDVTTGTGVNVAGN
ncbi:TPA: filamentous hemagglutinin N-terminal domain-containing protein, partial [Salmonella enterica]|nr:filamentous hemagglutinin N-terminal domain-containing protein [Salmonella enterica]